MKRYLVEFVGTFFLTLTIAALAVPGGGSGFGAIAIGAVLMVMVYCGGHVSGAHYNPAVTLAVFLRGRCAGREVAPYIASQLLAAGVGAVAGSILIDAEPDAVTASLPTGPTLLAEFLFTFALAFTVLHTATAKANAGNSFYGLAIGGIYMVGLVVASGLSLGSFNPAVSLMLVFNGKLAWIDSWMHLLPQLLAAVSAAYAFRAVCPEDP